MKNLEIYKYPLAIMDVQTVPTPKGAKFLSVQVQGGALQMWARVDPELPLMSAVVHIVGTGHSAGATAGMRHLGTVQLHDGSTVLHVFVSAER